MSLLAGCSTSAHRVLQKSSSLARGPITQQTRGAAQRNAPTVKKAQTIGGVKKGREEKWKAKIAKERAHTSRDLPVFTKMPEDRLKTPKTNDRPATLDPLFEFGTKPPPKLTPFGPKAITPTNVGKVTGFNIAPTNPAKVFGLPKKMFLEFRMMASPSSVIRNITIDTIELLDKAKDNSSQDTRVVFTGRAGCGKSYLLHQAVQYAVAQGWVVFYIPRAVSLVNSTTPHIYDLRTQTYLQPYAAYQAVSKLLNVNQSAFTKLKLTQALVNEKSLGPSFNDKSSIPAGTTLADLAGMCIKDKSYASAPVVLEAILGALEKQKEFPVLMAIDDFQSLFHKTAYKDPFFNSIKSFHLSMPRLILEFASGQRKFAKGAFLSSLTASDTTFTVPLELRDALGLEYAHPVSPYHRRSKELMQYLTDDGVGKGAIKNVPVPDKFSIEEASGVFEIWKNGGALGSRSYDELFLSKYVEADGNPRDFVWKGLLSTLTP